MANYEATRYNFDGADLTGIQGVNTGLIIPWCAAAAPSGFLECDGSAVSRSTYSALFAIVGTTYGSGDGSTTFNVPNLNNRIVKGKSPTTNLGTANNTNTVPVSGNLSITLANHTLTVPEMPSHTHSPGGGGSPGPFDTTGSGTPFFQGSGANVGPAGGSGGHNHPASGTFSGNCDVKQPVQVTMYIIKT